VADLNADLLHLGRVRFDAGQVVRQKTSRGGPSSIRMVSNAIIPHGAGIVIVVRHHVIDDQNPQAAASIARQAQERWIVRALANKRRRVARLEFAVIDDLVALESRRLVRYRPSRRP
jgi:hypothetical protein